MAVDERKNAKHLERDLFGRKPRKHQDWSHRRKEPRGLALAWTLYLMLASMVSLMPMVASGQLSSDVYRPAARVMMVMVVVGLVLLWPVLRLSQRPHSEAPILDVIRDLGVMMIPAFVIVWPQVILAGWPIPVVFATCAVLLVWSLIVASILMWWHRYSGGGWRGRVFAVGVLAGITGGVPLGLMTMGGLELGSPRPSAMSGWMWSPVTSVWEVLRARVFSGLPASVDATHWRIIQIQLGTATLGFLVSAGCCRGRMAEDSGRGYAPSERR